MEETLLFEADLSLSDANGDDIDQYWIIVGVNEGCLIEEARYPKRSELVEGLLTVLRSNTDVEQLFSQVNLIKTKNRNKLDTGTIDKVS